MDEPIKGQPRHRITYRFATIFLLATSVVAWFDPTDAQQPKKIPRIGIVRGDTNAPAPSIKIFRQALQELGYVEGKNIQFEYRYTEGSRDRAREIVAESKSSILRCNTACP